MWDISILEFVFWHFIMTFTYVFIFILIFIFVCMLISTFMIRCLIVFYLIDIDAIKKLNWNWLLLMWLRWYFFILKQYHISNYLSMFCSVISYFKLSLDVLFCHIIFQTIFRCSVLSYHISNYLSMFCSVISYFKLSLDVLSCHIIFQIISRCSVLSYHISNYLSMFCHIISYFLVLAHLAIQFLCLRYSAAVDTCASNW